MNLTALHKKFGTQEKCIAYLEKLKWGKHPVCNHCGSTNVTKRNKGIKWHCNTCKKDSSVMVNTIFEDTRLPLQRWFELIFIMNNAKMGISAREISDLVGIKYSTAWFTCHKVRCAMVTNELRLEGMVEFDEAYMGGKKRKHSKKEVPDNLPSLAEVDEKRGRGTHKVPIVGAVEKKGSVYVKIVEKLTGRNLLSMLKKVVKTDETVVFTDGFRSYKAFDKTVEHITIKHKEGHGSGVKTVNTIEGFFSIIKNGIKGSYRAISKKYLPFYLAEFAYKYNERHLQQNAFEILLENAVKDEKCLINYKPKQYPKKYCNVKKNKKSK